MSCGRTEKGLDKVLNQAKVGYGSKERRHLVRIKKKIWKVIKREKRVPIGRREKVCVGGLK